MIIVVAAVIEQQNTFLVAQRPPGTHLAGMWEFPGGKLEQSESHAQGLQRELREELGVEIEVGDLEFYTAHQYSERTVALYFYRCALAGPPSPQIGQQLRWVPREELTSLGFPPADAELIRRLVGSDPGQTPERGDSRS